MISKLNKEEVEDLLKSSLVGRIGCHAGGVTYIVPVSYAYQDDCVFVHTQEGMKLNLMRQNPAVCFQVDDVTDTSNWKSVIAWGTFEELHQQEDRIKALSLLNNRVLPLRSSSTMHLGGAWPFSYEDLTEIVGVVFRICLQEKTGRFESSGQTPNFPY